VHDRALDRATAAAQQLEDAEHESDHLYDVLASNIKAARATLVDGRTVHAALEDIVSPATWADAKQKLAVLEAAIDENDYRRTAAITQDAYARDDRFLWIASGNIPEIDPAETAQNLESIAAVLEGRVTDRDIPISDAKDRGQVIATAVADFERSVAAMIKSVTKQSELVLADNPLALPAVRAGLTKAAEDLTRTGSAASIAAYKRSVQAVNESQAAEAQRIEKERQRLADEEKKRLADEAKLSTATPTPTPTPTVTP
jgi:hypothetical protein